MKFILQCCSVTLLVYVVRVGICKTLLLVRLAMIVCFDSYRRESFYVLEQHAMRLYSHTAAVIAPLVRATSPAGHCLDLPANCFPTSVLLLQHAMRFYSHTVAVIALLVAAHIACFVTSVVMLERQKQYIDEVDDAGIACIAMHRMAIDCRWVCLHTRFVCAAGGGGCGWN